MKAKLKLQREIDAAAKENKEKLWKQMDALDDKLNSTQKSMNGLNKKFKKGVGDFGLDLDELSDIFEETGEAGLQSAIKLHKTKTGISKFTSALGINFNALGAEMFTVAGIITLVSAQVMKLNDALIELQRKSGGALNANSVGFSRYGANTTRNTGSLETMTAQSNIEISQFMEALQGFNKGQVAGLSQDLNNSSQELQDFGLAQGRLIKLYGVSSTAVSTLTENMTQLYGSSIKGLSKDLQNAATMARTAGINVNYFFENLAAVSELTGEYFIADGIAGMERMAMVASKLNISISSMMHGAEKFNDFTSLFEEQNKATALGLTAYAANYSRIFAKYQLGDLAGSSQLKYGSLAQDISSRGLGHSNVGIQMLKGAGLNQDEIKSVQRLIIQHEKLNISFEKLSGQAEMTAEEIANVRAEEYKNMTLVEKAKQIWTKVKSAIIDPLAAVFGPIFGGLLDVVGAVTDAFVWAMKPIVTVFNSLGKFFSCIEEGAAKLFGFTSAVVDGTDKTVGGLKALMSVIGTVIEAFLILKAATYAATAAEEAKAAGGWLKGLFGKGGKGAAVAQTAEDIAANGLRKPGGLGMVVEGGAAGGGMLAMMGQIGGQLIGNTVGGQTGNIISNTASMAGTGAMIGSLVPVIGTGIGAIVGGLIGLGTSLLDPLKETAENTKKSSEETEKANKKNEDRMKIASATFASDPFDIAKTVVKGRVINNFAAQEAQAARVEKTVNPLGPTVNVKVESGIFNKGNKLGMSGR
jgi:hypothetical protein